MFSTVVLDFERSEECIDVFFFFLRLSQKTKFNRSVQPSYLSGKDLTEIVRSKGEFYRKLERTKISKL